MATLPFLYPLNVSDAYVSTGLPIVLYIFTLLAVKRYLFLHIMSFRLPNNLTPFIVWFYIVSIQAFATININIQVTDHIRIM